MDQLIAIILTAITQTPIQQIKHQVTRINQALVTIAHLMIPQTQHQTQR